MSDNGKNRVLFKISVDPQGRFHLDTDKDPIKNRDEYIRLLADAITQITHMRKEPLIQQPGDHTRGLRRFLKR